MVRIVSVAVLLLVFGVVVGATWMEADGCRSRRMETGRVELDAAPTELTDAGALAASIAKPIKHRCSPHIQRVFGRVPYDPRALFRRAGWPSDSDVDSK